MKTVKEWIETISDKTVKEKMYFNVENYGSVSGRVKLKKRYEYMHNAICGMFFWDYSPEGHDFWEAIHTFFCRDNEGKKSYEDFKHLDKSAK